MKLFEIFDLEAQFQLDTAKLKRSFLRKSREYHPDFHGNASEEEQEAMLDKSSALNEAYETLKEKRARIRYILKESGVLKEGEEKVPQSFLMEMMDFNEKLMDLEMSDDASEAEKLRSEAGEKLKALEEECESYEKAYDKGEEKMEMLEKIKTIYLKQQYLHRILGNLDEM